MSAISGPGQQQSLTDALQAAAADEEPATVTDDRVVDDALMCECGRPAGADGMCYAHRMENINGGRRL